MKKKAQPSPQKPKRSALQPEERKQRSLADETETLAVVDAAGLFSDLRNLIQSAHQRIATVAYSTQTLLCWHVGRRLLNENLQGGRAAYGKQILVTVSRELTAAEQVELLELDAKSIRVSEYLTELPPLPLLLARLHQAIEHARENAARQLPAAEERK